MVQKIARRILVVTQKTRESKNARCLPSHYPYNNDQTIMTDNTTTDPPNTCENNNDESPKNLLFFGNSYIMWNSLQNMVKELNVEHYDSAAVIKTRQHARNGGQLSQYVSDGSVKDQLSKEPYWNWVVLQEQSQLPGMCVVHYDQLFRPSLDAVLAIDALAKEHNRSEDVPPAETVLLCTWGHRDGDKRNKQMWPSFLPMNHMLQRGYELYREAIIEKREDRSAAKVAPVGLAFEIVYNQTRDKLIQEHGSDAGEKLLNPAQPGTDFHGLYRGDGRHPSPEGSYLAACVVYATMIDYTGEEPLGRRYAPEGMTEERRDYLQSVCELTIRAAHTTPSNDDAAATPSPSDQQ